MKGMKFSFKKIFGGKKSDGTSLTNASKSEKEGHKNTLERIREMEELLQRKQTFLESKIGEQVTEARKCGKANKRAALMALRRKKRLEAELIRIDGTLTTIELQREALESARNNLQVLEAMKDAANVLKNAQKYVTADKVLDIMDEVNEQQELAKEIADAIANPLGGMDSSIDDEELEKELEDLEQEELDRALLRVNGIEQTDEPAGAQHETGGGGAGASSSSSYPTTSPGTQSDFQKDKVESKAVEIVDPDEKELQELAQWSN